MTSKLLIVMSLDREQGDGGSAITSQVVEFDSQDLADLAFEAIERQDKNVETYTQVEAFKLY